MSFQRQIKNICNGLFVIVIKILFLRDANMICKGRKLPGVDSEAASLSNVKDAVIFVFTTTWINSKRKIVFLCQHFYPKHGC